MGLALGVAGTVIRARRRDFTALEWRARRRADATERRDRIEQIDLVRRQVAATERQAALEEAASEASRSADVRVKGGGQERPWLELQSREHRPGRCDASEGVDVRAETGASVGSPYELSAPLLAGEETGRQVLIALSEDLIQEGPALRLMLSWVDTRERERQEDYSVNL